MATNPKPTPPIHHNLTIADIDGCHDPFTDIFVISPELAAFILKERNPNNRGISPTKAAQTVHDVAHGAFTLNGESIIFSSEGNLLDGQHRLGACVEAAKPITSVVALGFPPSAGDTVDQGKARTAGDTLTRNGGVNGNVTACVARFLIGYHDNDGTVFGRAGEYSNAELITWIDSHPTLAPTVAWAMSLKTLTTGFVTVTQMALARSILEPKYGKTEVVRFLEQVAFGEHIGRTDPAFAVRKRLSMEKNKTGKRLSNHLAVEILMRGFLAYHLKRDATKIQLMGTLPTIARSTRLAKASDKADAPETGEPDLKDAA
jgi:hypothetical protein